MKKKIKKNRLKIFIALSLMFTLITTIFIGTKTFAYTDENNNTYYDYNQIVQNGNFTNTNNWNVSGGTFSVSNNIGTLILNGSSAYPGITATYNLIVGHKYIINLEFKGNTYIGLNFGGYDGLIASELDNSIFNNINVIKECTTTRQNFTFYVRRSDTPTGTLEFKNIMVTDLTQMFGQGNEPTTTNEAINYFNILDINLNNYQEYTTSKYMYISNNSNTEYNELEDENEQLRDDYYQLNNDYSELEDDYSELEDDYNELETNYNELENDYNDLINTDTNGIWAYFNIFNIGYTNDNNEYQALESYQSLEDFKNSQYNYINNIEINLSNLKTRYQNVNKFIFSCLAANPPVRPLLNSISYRINNNGNNCQNVVYFNLYDNGITINYTNLIQMNFRVNYDNINEYIGYYDPNQTVTILIFEIEYNNNNNFSITSLNNEYNNGYAVGYQNGSNSRNAYINYLDNQVTNLTQEVTNQQITINSLNEQISSFSSDYNLNNLMWTIGGTPFESFKHIWNINFLGVNIADFVLGFITTFIGLWILKKFFL